MKQLPLLLIFSLLGPTLLAQTFYQAMGGPLIPASQFQQYCDSSKAKLGHGKKMGKDKMVVNIEINEVEQRDDSTINHFGFAISLGYSERKAAKSVFSHLGEPFPDFDLVDLEGHPVRKADLIGKKVFINFWFVTCHPCIAEIPDLEKLQAKYASEDVLFLAMTFEKSKKVSEFLERKQFGLTHVPDAGKICKALDMSSFPNSIVLDEEGKIQRIDNGMEGLFTEEFYQPLRAHYQRLFGPHL